MPNALLDFVQRAARIGFSLGVVAPGWCHVRACHEWLPSYEMQANRLSHTLWQRLGLLLRRRTLIVSGRPGASASPRAECCGSEPNAARRVPGKSQTPRWILIAGRASSAGVCRWHLEIHRLERVSPNRRHSHRVLKMNPSLLVDSIFCGDGAISIRKNRRVVVSFFSFLC
jgi:hypothetical protein